MTRIPDAFLVCDLETSSLDPATGHILEVGAILVEGTAPFAEIGRANMVLHPGADREQLWGSMHPVVREMHQASGLWQETASPDAWSLTEADKALRDWVVARTAKPDSAWPMICIAGTGVAQFDLPWIRIHMPHLASLLHYRPCDTTVMHTILALAGRDDLLAPFQTEPVHRALPDCELGLAELRLWVELMGRIPTATLAGQA